jgi:ATP-dependent Clp protease adaptor protein ClpS
MSDDDRTAKGTPTGGTDVQEREETKVQEPELYRVILHNDDYTTMDFVIEILVVVFQKNMITAARLMLNVHQKGRAEVGTYTYDIARTKVDKVRQMAETRQFPLLCTMEKA